MANPYAKGTNPYGANANNPYYVVEDTTAQKNLGSLAQLAMQAYGIKKIASRGSSSTEPSLLTKGWNKLKEVVTETPKAEPVPEPKVTLEEATEGVEIKPVSVETANTEVLEDLAEEKAYVSEIPLEDVAENVSTKGLEAFDLAVEDAIAEQAYTAGAAEATAAAEDLTAGLDAFDLAVGDAIAEGEYMGSLGSGSGWLEAESAAGGLEGAGSGAGAGSSAAGGGGGASLGLVTALIKGGMLTKDAMEQYSWRGDNPTSNDLKEYLANSSQHPVAASNLFNIATPADYVLLDTGLVDRESEVGKIMDIPGRIERGVMDKLGEYCIIVSACTGRDSYEVNVARKYRDRHMSEEELTGYYTLCIFVVPFIYRYPLLRRLVKRLLVDRLVDYGEWRLDMKPEMKYLTSGVVKRAFLGLCRHVGRGVDTVLAGQEV